MVSTTIIREYIRKKFAGFNTVLVLPAEKVALAIKGDECIITPINQTELDSVSAIVGKDLFAIVINCSNTKVYVLENDKATFF